MYTLHCVTLLLLTTSLAECCGRKSNLVEQDLHPIVFVPGLGGSIIQAKTNQLYDDPTCAAKSTWHRLWLSLSKMLSYQKCVTDWLQLRNDDETGRSYNARGIDTRIPYWGSMKAVNYVDRSILVRLAADIKGNKGVYALRFTRLMTFIGYEQDKNLVAAPYDFRYAPRSQDVYFKKLKILIEDIYNKNRKRRVIIVAHSLGGLMTHRFLLSMSSVWKKKFIESFVPVAVPWAGSVKALYFFSTGRTANHSIIDHDEHGNMLRTWQTSVATLPMPSAWKEHEVFMKTNDKNYTINDMQAYFKDLGMTFALRNYEAIKRHIGSKMKYPGVDVSLVYSRGIPTASVIDFTGKNYPDDKPNIIKGDGDGSVNVRSLLAVSHWSNSSGHFTYNEQKQNGVDHTDVLSSKVMVNVIMKINRSN